MSLDPFATPQLSLPAAVKFLSRPNALAQRAPIDPAQKPALAAPPQAPAGPNAQTQLAVQAAQQAQQHNVQAKIARTRAEWPTRFQALLAQAFEPGAYSPLAASKAASAPLSTAAKPAAKGLNTPVAPNPFASPAPKPPALTAAPMAAPKTQKAPVTPSLPGSPLKTAYAHARAQVSAGRVFPRTGSGGTAKAAGLRHHASGTRETGQQKTSHHAPGTQKTGGVAAALGRLAAKAAEVTFPPSPIPYPAPAPQNAPQNMPPGQPTQTGPAPAPAQAQAAAAPSPAPADPAAGAVPGQPIPGQPMPGQPAQQPVDPVVLESFDQLLAQGEQPSDPAESAHYGKLIAAAFRDEDPKTSFGKSADGGLEAPSLGTPKVTPKVTPKMAPKVAPKLSAPKPAAPAPKAPAAPAGFARGFPAAQAAKSTSLRADALAGKTFTPSLASVSAPGYLEKAAPAARAFRARPQGLVGRQQPEWRQDISEASLNRPVAAAAGTPPAETTAGSIPATASYNADKDKITLGPQALSEPMLPSLPSVLRHELTHAAQRGDPRPVDSVAPQLGSYLGRRDEAEGFLSQLKHDDYVASGRVATTPQAGRELLDKAVNQGLDPTQVNAWYGVPGHRMAPRNALIEKLKTLPEPQRNNLLNNLANLLPGIVQGPSVASALGKAAGLKRAAQDNAASRRLSATGESTGLSYQHKPDSYAQGPDAWASVGQYLHKKPAKKPDPFAGRH